MGKKRVVTEQIFKEVKRLNKLGFTCRQIAQRTGICWNTVSILVRHSNLESYFENVREISTEKRLKKKMAKGIAITNEVFNQIKASCDRKIPNNKIAEVFGVSSSTVSTINTSKDFEEYKTRIASYGKKDSDYPIITVKRTNDLSSYSKESEIMDIIRKQNETGEDILQQILWMVRTIGVTIGALYDLVLNRNQATRNNQITEMNVFAQNQQRQIELLEELVKQWNT